MPSPTRDPAVKVKKDRSSYLKQWRLDNAEHVIKWRKLAYEANQERESEQSKGYYTKNRSHILARAIKWNTENNSRRRAQNAKRRSAARRNLWGQKEKIDAVYSLAKTMTLLFGSPYEVDHRYPLNGRQVCGLHIEQNLQVISKAENQRKGNRPPARKTADPEIKDLLKSWL